MIIDEYLYFPSKKKYNANREEDKDGGTNLESSSNSEYSLYTLVHYHLVYQGVRELSHRTSGVDQWIPIRHMHSSALVAV